VLQHELHLLPGLYGACGQLLAPRRQLRA
jgi:hypothetical protein